MFTLRTWQTWAQFETLWRSFLKLKWLESNFLTRLLTRFKQKCLFNLTGDNKKIFRILYTPSAFAKQNEWRNVFVPHTVWMLSLKDVDELSRGINRVAGSSDCTAGHERLFCPPLQGRSVLDGKNVIWTNKYPPGQQSSGSCISRNLWLFALYTFGDIFHIDSLSVSLTAPASRLKETMRSFLFTLSTGGFVICFVSDVL